MVCENCQAEISDNAVICPYCKSFTKNMTSEIQKKLEYSIDDSNYTKLRKLKSPTLIKLIIQQLIFLQVTK